MFFHNRPKKEKKRKKKKERKKEEKPCIGDPLRELSTGVISLKRLEKWLAPGFVWTCLLEPWRQQFSQFHLNHLKMTISLYKEADGKLKQKWLVVETHWRGACEQFSLLSAGLRAQFFSFFPPQEDHDYLGAQRIATMWMSSKRCQLQGEGVSPSISGNHRE